VDVLDGFLVDDAEFPERDRGSAEDGGSRAPDELVSAVLFARHAAADEIAVIRAQEISWTRDTTIRTSLE